MSDLLWFPAGQSVTDKKLAVRWWKNRYKNQVPPRGFLFLFHGMGEHSGRYSEMAEFFAHWGFDVLAPDFPGHGLTASDGEWGDLEGVRKWTELVDLMIDHWYVGGPRSRAELKGVPYYIFGHSYGGLTALNWARKIRDRSSLLPAAERIAISGAPLKLKIAVPPLKKVAAKLAARAAPYLKIPSGIKPEMVSADPVIQYRYESDVLNHSYASPAMFNEMLEVAEEVNQSARDLEMPVMICAAENDPLADPEGMKNYYGNLGTQKKLLVFKNSRHEVHNDAERREMYEELLKWLS